MMVRSIPRTFLVLSRNLRKNQTPWEAKLWSRLRANRFFGLKFKRQAKLGGYIVDFYSPSLLIPCGLPQVYDCENPP